MDRRSTRSEHSGATNYCIELSEPIHRLLDRCRQCRSVGHVSDDHGAVVWIGIDVDSENLPTIGLKMSNRGLTKSEASPVTIVTRAVAPIHGSCLKNTIWTVHEYHCERSRLRERVHATSTTKRQSSTSRGTPPGPAVVTPSSASAAVLLLNLRGLRAPRRACCAMCRLRRRDPCVRTRAKQRRKQCSESPESPDRAQRRSCAPQRRVADASRTRLIMMNPGDVERETGKLGCIRHHIATSDQHPPTRPTGVEVLSGAACALRCPRSQSSQTPEAGAADGAASPAPMTSMSSLLAGSVPWAAGGSIAPRQKARTGRCC